MKYEGTKPTQHTVDRSTKFPFWWNHQKMSVWMDWFKGKFTGKPHDLHGKIYGFRLRFSLKPIHWLLQQTTSIGGFKNRGHEPGAGCTWLGLSQQHPSSTGGLRERLAEFPSRDDGELQGRRLNQLACWFISLLILNKWYIYIYIYMYIYVYIKGFHQWFI